MKYFLPLFVLITVFLVPYGWIAEQSPVLNYLFNQVFHNVAAHVVGHSIIFAVIGIVALKTIPALRRWPAAYIALILAVALGQEYLQMVYKGQFYLVDTLIDLLVDLAAAAVAWAFVYLQTSASVFKGARQR